jgi:hypothetical protein
MKYHLCMDLFLLAWYMHLVLVISPFMSFPTVVTRIVTGDFTVFHFKKERDGPNQRTNHTATYCRPVEMDASSLPDCR